MANFKEAFAAARNAKKATFDWNGKSYSTQLKGEPAGMTKGPKARPKPPGAERPKARPKPPGAEPAAAQRADASPPNKNRKYTPAAAQRADASPPNKNRKYTPMGESTGIGGRAAEAVKGLMGALRGKPAAKPKTAFKTPDRSTVGKKK
jgi:hypothetical protein